jgi:hypothetical protein
MNRQWDIAFSVVGNYGEGIMRCGKRCFSLKRARTALNQAKRSKRQRRRETRMYYCHACNAYHLTSMEALR